MKIEGWKRSKPTSTGSVMATFKADGVDTWYLNSNISGNIIVYDGRGNLNGSRKTKVLNALRKEKLI